MSYEFSDGYVAFGLGAGVLELFFVENSPLFISFVPRFRKPDKTGCLDGQKKVRYLWFSVSSISIQGYSTTNAYARP